MLEPARRRLDQRMEWLGRCALFQGISLDYIQNLLFSLKDAGSIPRGHRVFACNQPFEGLHFVGQGQVSVLQQPGAAVASRPQSTQPTPRGHISSAAAWLAQVQDAADACEQKSTSSCAGALSARRAKAPWPMAVLGPGEVFGEDGWQSGTHTLTAVTDTACRLFVLAPGRGALLNAKACANLQGVASRRSLRRAAAASEAPGKARSMQLSMSPSRTQPLLQSAMSCKLARAQVSSRHVSTSGREADNRSNTVEVLTWQQLLQAAKQQRRLQLESHDEQRLQQRLFAAGTAGGLSPRSPRRSRPMAASVHSGACSRPANVHVHAANADARSMQCHTETQCCAASPAMQLAALDDAARKELSRSGSACSTSRPSSGNADVAQEDVATQQTETKAPRVQVPLLNMAALRAHQATAEPQAMAGADQKTAVACPTAGFLKCPSSARHYLASARSSTVTDPPHGCITWRGTTDPCQLQLSGRLAHAEQAAASLRDGQQPAPCSARHQQTPRRSVPRVLRTGGNHTGAGYAVPSVATWRGSADPIMGFAFANSSMSLVGGVPGRISAVHK